MKLKGFITASTLITLVLAMPFASSILIKGMTAGMIYQDAQKVPISEIAVVLGAAAYSPTSISDALKDRLDTAIELYNGKKVSRLLLTGAANEVVAMNNYLIGQGLSVNAIIEDSHGTNTLASIENIPRKYDKITIITQRYHLPRALFYARHFGFEAIGVSADRREYARIFDFKKRELLAASKAMWDVFFGSAR